ncbi:MAG: hypothetical protein GKR93_01070 [Gammaproteobacteria bacterium]|nr:hypothetical protein [Gammaproteobacteria bacterium]
MLSRRVFLLSAFAVSGLPLLTSVASSTGYSSKKVLVLSENGCSDSSAFASCLPVKPIEADPSLLLQELDKSLREKEYEFVFGLSRDSNFVLIEQYAQQNAYRLHYHGSHQYQRNTLTHSVRGNKEILESLSSQLSGNESWTSVLGQIPTLSDYADESMLSGKIESIRSAPANSSGHLVSWLFKVRQA